ncbi:hypothetical protein RJ640_014052 [Escallonia rubra]|uniref:SBP-type domain-containing protein n=1 Tax=Escallonia rubra TaxID=112253 RepID=A0AA88RJE4_9ASTE|nr:hypothetical protein RJ640_014052 [Escallonia rubra]
MDWNLKTLSWDLTEFDQETVPNIDSIGGSTRFGVGGQGSRGAFSVDLKLGQVDDTGTEYGGNLRARQFMLNIASGVVYVERERVQFHSLEEFDEGKRSCRKRLDGHNRRRRKPQSEPMSRAGSFFSSNQGGRLLTFSSPQVYATASVANPTWAGIVKAEEDAKNYNQHSHSRPLDKESPYPESSSSTNKGGNRLGFLHSTNLKLGNQTAQEASVCRPLFKTTASFESGGSSNKMFCDGFSARVAHSDFALSLLSSSPSQTSGISLSHAMQPNSIPTAHPLHTSLNYDRMEPMESIGVPSAGNSDVHCQGMFHMPPHASRDNGTPQTLPFYWE